MDKIILGDPLTRFPHLDNAAVLARLGQGAGKPTVAKRRTHWYIDEYDIHTHPDLVERMEELCLDIPDVFKSAAYGYPILVTPSGVIFGYATGTGFVALRLPARPEVGDVLSDLKADALGPDWVYLEVWKDATTAVIPGLIRTSVDYVTSTYPIGTTEVASEPRLPWTASWKRSDNPS